MNLLKKMAFWTAPLWGAACTGGSVQTVAIENSPYVPVGYTLVWNDEFQSSDVVSLPDTTKWILEQGGGCWGNDELQYYIPAVRGTDTTAFVKQGILTIRALIPKQPVEGYNYLSARMKTKENWKYGYFEGRMKLPGGTGTWPAFWMLPPAFKQWPLEGEIDIMEHVGSHPDTIHITVHTQKYNHTIGTQKTAVNVISGVRDDYHVYGLEWTPQEIKGYVDGTLYFTYPNDGKGDKESWPFDTPFLLLLNQAVGGTFGGQKGVDNTVYPADFQIDYVRVYQKNNENK